MIDTQRLGALLRALIRDDAQAARLRTPAIAAVRPAAGAGPELDAPGAQRVPATVTPRSAASGMAVDALAVDEHPANGAARNGAAAPLNAPPRNGNAPGTPRDGQNGHASPSAALELSDTGRLLLSALRAAGAPLDGVTVPRGAMQPRLNVRDDVQSSTQAAATRPLVSVPPHSEYATDRLALQLKDAVEFSGVFYESHLAQWADDMRPRALLAHEPQSRWPVAAHAAQAAAGVQGTPADYAAPLLRQQLEVLDSGRFVWTGELWPGQSGSLVIEQDDPPPHRHGDAAPRSTRWRMRMTLTFAQLGPVEAALTLAGETLELGLRCDDAAVAQRLREATPALRTAIAARALDLAHVSIDDDRAF